MHEPLSRQVVGMVAAVVALATVPACASDDDGGGGPENGGACIEEVFVLAAPDEETALGFSVDDVLAPATGSFVSPFHWVAAEYASGGPEAGGGELELTIRHQGSPARLILSSAPESKEGYWSASESDCRDRIEVDVEVTATTTGGALRESTRGTLTSVDGERVDLVAALDPARIAGSLAVTPHVDGFAVQSITISAGFARGFTWGALDVVTGTVSSDEGGGGGVMPATIARWPGTKGCAPFFDGIVVPLDARALPFSAEDVATRLGEVRGTLTWDAGGSTPLTVRLEPVGGSACAVEDGPRGLGPALLYDARLHLLTEDDRVDAALDVAVETIVGDDGQLHSALDARNHQLGPVPVDVFEDTFGIHGFDLTGFGDVLITLEATIVDAATTGSFEVQPRLAPDCSGDERGRSGGCPQADRTSVGGASWSVP